MSRRAVTVTNLSNASNRVRVTFRRGRDDAQAVLRLRDRRRARAIVEQLVGFLERMSGRRLRLGLIVRRNSPEIVEPMERLADWILCHVIQETREADRRLVCLSCAIGTPVCQEQRRKHSPVPHHHHRGDNGHDYATPCSADRIPRAART